MRSGPTSCRASASCRARLRYAWPLAIVAVTVAVLVGGCTVGRYYRGVPLRADPNSLQEGESTRRDVLRLFGPPDRILQNASGDTFIYEYERENYSSFRLQDPVIRFTWFTYSRSLGQRDRLVVVFDLSGVVRGVAVDQHTEDLPML